MALKHDSPIYSSTEKPTTLVHDTEVCYDGSNSIPLEFRGSATDYKDMQVLGKSQELWRNFRFFTMLGFASTVMASWEFVLPYVLSTLLLSASDLVRLSLTHPSSLFIFGLTNGGTALMFWGFIAVAIAMSLVYASLAELASMSPTAGGQYHWVSELTPPRWQKPLSYTVGWLTSVGWQIYICGSAFISANIIQGLIVLNVENYVWHNWHGTLLTIALIFASVILNVIFSKKLPFINGCLFVLHSTGFIAVFVTLWVLSDHSGTEVLFDFRNDGGWPSTGLSAMVGLISPLSVLVGFDCSVHMSEEIQDASITLPRAMMSSVAVNMSLGFLMAVTFIFNVGDVDNILATATGQPFIQLFYNTTQNYAATNILTAIIVVMLFGGAVNEVAACSRQLWSFARDDGVPAAAWLSKITPGWDLPLQAVLVSVILNSLLACINLVSSTALNAIISLGLVSILSSYFVTIGCLIWRRLSGPPLPPRRWSLGRWGLVINMAAELCLLPLWFFMFWPTALPVTAVSMNWSSTIFGGIVILALVFYAVRGRHVYRGPVVLMKRDD